MENLNVSKLKNWVIKINIPKDYSEFYDLHINELVNGKCERSKWIDVSIHLLKIGNDIVLKKGLQNKRIIIALPLKEECQISELQAANAKSLINHLNEYTPPSIYVVADLKVLGKKKKMDALSNSLAPVECYYSEYEALGSPEVSKTIWFYLPINSESDI